MDKGFPMLKMMAALIELAALVLLSSLVFRVAPTAADPAAEEEKKIPPQVRVMENEPTASAECGKCHKDIYDAWKNSLHSQAASNPVFWTSYLKVYYQDDRFAQQTCLNCHAPLARLLGDPRLAREPTREGVNCDFCHSVSAVRAAGNGFEFEQSFGVLKQGPLKNVVSPVHQTRFNPLYQESRICAVCHEYENADGLKLLETFGEWERGPYAREGIHCQNCHMRKVSGKIVREEILRIPENEVSSHDIAGGHSLSQRENSLRIDIKSVRRNRQKVEVTVDIANVGAGHSIPTGLPSKKIVLRVSVPAASGEGSQTQQRVYQKRIVDDRGNPVDEDSELMSGRGYKIASDNRLKPRESRRETFTFFVSDSERESLRVSAAAYYDHSPQVMETSPIHIKLKEVSRVAEP
jgi:hypothetical protein